MKRQRGFIVVLAAAWAAIAAVVGGVATVNYAMNDTGANYAMKDKALTAPAQLDWAALSSQTVLARSDAPAYIGTSLTETQAPGRLDWAALSK